MSRPRIRLIAGTAPDHTAPAPDAEVIILTLNRADDSVAAIRSALDQVGVHRRVLVLDQGSNGSELERLAAAVRDRRDAALYRTDRNLGVGGGRNVLTALGTARVIVGIDNDAVFGDPSTLSRMVATLDAAPDVAAIGCRIVTDATGTDDLSSWGYPASMLPRAGGWFDTVTFVGAGHAIRRDAWDQAGPYDAGLFFCWEEYDFCLRAIAKGWRIAYRGDLVIRHKVSPEQRQTWSDRRWFHFVRNRLYIERKTGAGWVELLPRIGGYAIKGLLHGLPGPTLRAIIAATAMTPDHPIRLSKAALAYLARHDTARRGGLWQRWKNEVLGRLPDQPNRSRASSVTMAGLSRK